MVRLDFFFAGKNPHGEVCVSTFQKICLIINFRKLIFIKITRRHCRAGNKSKDSKEIKRLIFLSNNLQIINKIRIARTYNLNVY